MTALQVFEKFVPPPAVAYCVQLYERLGFEFKIKKARQTKFGDYRYNRTSGKQVITINNDLNPYAFLVTYLHEVAHLIAFQKFGRKIQPHGKEWKACFQEVASPVLTDDIFDPNVLKALQDYFKNPKASSCSDPTLYLVLKSYDPEDDKVLLKTLPPGSSFLFNDRSFQKLETKRTRSVCQELASGRKYMISDLAEVIPE